MTAILLVEDNEMNRDMLSRRLIRKGYEVHVAVDGVEGLEKALELKPPIILLDMSLPTKDGWEVARELKGGNPDWPVRIIALTAHVLEGDREKAIEAGCDDYETKPVDMLSLLGRIEAHLSELGVA